MSHIREVWMLVGPLNAGFRSISQTFYRATIPWWVDQRQVLADTSIESSFQDIVLSCLMLLSCACHFFWEQHSKYCIVEFTATLVCFLLNWSRQYSIKWSSNLDGLLFRQRLTSIPQFLNMINFCPNIWFIENLKCQQFHFEIFHIFKEPLFRTVWPYWYECWRILRDFCWLSKKCGFATFPKYS